MKPVNEDMYEEPAKIGIKHILAFLAYEGDNTKYYQKAKSGAVLVTAHVKSVQSATNRMAIEVTRLRMKELVA